MKRSTIAVLLMLLVQQIRPDASQYTNSCHGCVTHNYLYCPTDNVCRDQTSSCGATEYDITTGCDVASFCAVGNGGEIFIGDATLAGGYDLTGEVTFSAPSGNPCAIILHNKNSEIINIAVSGTNVGAYSFVLDYPFDTTATGFNNGIQLSAADNLVHLYVGSTSTGAQTAKVNWAKHVDIIPSDPESSRLVAVTLTFFALALAMIL